MTKAANQEKFAKLRLKYIAKSDKMDCYQKATESYICINMVDEFESLKKKQDLEGELDTLQRDYGIYVI